MLFKRSLGSLMINNQRDITVGTFGAVSLLACSSRETLSLCLSNVEPVRLEVGL